MSQESSKIYELQEIAERVRPIAEKYDIKSIYVFGSYARGEATEASDVDLLLDLEDSKVRGIIYYGLFDEFADALNKEVDLVTLDALNTPANIQRNPYFRPRVLRDRKEIYARTRLREADGYPIAL